MTTIYIPHPSDLRGKVIGGPHACKDMSDLVHDADSITATGPFLFVRIDGAVYVGCVRCNSEWHHVPPDDG